MNRLILSDDELILLGKTVLAKFESDAEYTDAEIGQALRAEVEYLRRVQQHYGGPMRIRGMWPED